MIKLPLARFLVVGAANTFVGLSVIFACKAFLAMGDVRANLTGYAVAVVLGFVLNKHWTFEDSSDPLIAFGRYIVVLIVAYVANLATTLLAIDVLGFDSYLAQALGVAPYAVIGYLGGRWYAFPFRPTNSRVRVPQ